MELESKLLKFIREQYTTSVAHPRSRYLCLDNKPIKEIGEWLKTLPSNVRQHPTILEILVMSDKEKKEFWGSVADLYRQQEREAKEQYLRDQVADASGIDFTSISLITDIQTGKHHLVTPEHQLLEASAFAYLSTFPQKQREDVVMMSPRVRLSYEPYSLQPMRILDDPIYGRISEYNTCTLPDWRYKEIPKVPCPPMLEKHFKYFFRDDEKVIHYFYSWMKQAVFKRCATYLVLCGTKGTGKNLLLDVFKKLVGSNNYGLAQRSFLTKEFNKVIKNKVIVGLDELIIKNFEQLEKLKAYINEEQNLEGKGIEADKVERIFASYVITNNSKMNLKFEQDDRRFSVLPIATTPMKQCFGDDYVARFAKELETNPKMVEDFGSFLYHYDTADFDNHTPFKSETFYEIVLLSLNIWQRTLYDTLTSRKVDEYKYSSIFKKKTPMGERPKSISRAEEWLHSYTYEGEPIGTVKQDEDGDWWIIPNKNLMPIEED